MPDFESRIEGFVRGDDHDVIRLFPGVPPGQSIAEAWLTVKAAPGDLDTSVFQKHINSINTAGQGQITDNGSVSGVAQMIFTMTGGSAGDTAKLTADQKYVFDVQLKTSSAKHWTPEKGTMEAEEQVTIAE